MQDTIIVQGLSKQFRRYHSDRALTFQEAFLRGLRKVASVERFWALRDVTFNIAPGHMVGVIGSNGAGKSTLLNLIGGIMRPDRGTVKANGRIGALLDLGGGFHPDLTGRENVYINGAISGLTRKEIAHQFDLIVDFAELEEFIDNPLRTYSSGMKMRLAFAVAAHVEPEILLIDEVLAVGDISFQRKCLDRIAQFKADGNTILFVSHDSTSVRRLCDEVLWLRKGQLVTYGPADIIVDQYVDEMGDETKRRTPKVKSSISIPSGSKLQVNKNRFGSLEMEIVAVKLLNSLGVPITELEGGEPLHIELEYFTLQPIEAPIFGVSIHREDGFICCDTNTAIAGLTMPTVKGRGKITLQIERLDLTGGSYFVDVAVYEANWAYAYDYHWHVYPLHIQRNGGDKGILRPPHHWEFTDTPVQKAALPTLKLP